MKSNIPDSIKQKIGKKLHNKSGHPIKIVKDHIYKYFDSLNYKFDKFDDFDPKTSIEDNFDSLLIPKDHPSRSIHDTYYIDDNTVLRTHTSAHQCGLLQKGYRKFLVSGDVYRKDEIDCRHYPVFHQMEGVCLVDSNVNSEEDLQNILSELVKYLFPNSEYRFNSDYFPFTEPSFEIEVKFNGIWMEILGCGVIHQQILNNLNKTGEKGWAFGIGLERIAMILFDIPDIRYFWIDDTRFLDQFKDEILIKFKPYSKLDAVNRDISFWIPSEEITVTKNGIICWNNINDFYELVRDICENNINSVTFTNFYHPKKQKYSFTFRFKIEADIAETNPSNHNDCANKLTEKIANVLKEDKKYEVR